MHKILNYLISVFSEADGTGSATRVLAGLTVLATLMWVTFIVIKNHALPDLGGASMFISAAFSGYAINKIEKVVNKQTDPKVDPPKNS
jgi:hypothetical protein